MKLRVCKTLFFNKESKKYIEEDFYFHGWTQVKGVNTHPEDPQKDHMYSYTCAILEHIRTGKIEITYPDSITFIK